MINLYKVGKSFIDASVEADEIAKRFNDMLITKEHKVELLDTKNLRNNIRYSQYLEYGNRITLGNAKVTITNTMPVRKTRIICESCGAPSIAQTECKYCGTFGD